MSYNLELAPEVERRARKIRRAWTEDDREARYGARPATPLAAANPTYVREYVRRRQIRAIVIPMPVKPVEIATEPEPLLRPRKQKPPFRPIGEVIAEIIGRLTGVA